MSQRTLSPHFLHQFVQTTAAELGQDNLSTVLVKAGLPSDWGSPAHLDSLDEVIAAKAYAGLQQAMRTYYGRGARGILMRVGSKLWDHLLDGASLPLKAQAKVLRGLPLNARRKAALELLANLLGSKKGDVTVHTLDLDLLLADHASPSTLDQSDSEHICYVTLGLLRECLFWATGKEPDIEETSCRANGEDSCEFKIIVGG